MVIKITDTDIQLLKQLMTGKDTMPNDTNDKIYLTELIWGGIYPVRRGKLLLSKGLIIVISKYERSLLIWDRICLL